MANNTYFFVKRPIVALVISIILVITGSLAVGTLAIEQYPNITPPVVQVRANYTGANAITGEQSVATPLEQQINGVENMIYMKSTNANDGSVSIDVSFEVGTDPDMNTVNTQNRVSAATAKLPEEVKRLGVTTQKSMPNILMLINLTADNPEFNQEFLGNYANINIKDRLARIPGIGRADVLGAPEYAMRIWVKPDQLAQRGVSISEIIDAIRQQNVVIAGGKFGGEPAPPGTAYTYTVRMPDRLKTVEEFERIVVRTFQDGSQLRVGDVARVEMSVESFNAFTRLTDRNLEENPTRPSAIIALYQAPGSNAVALAENIKAEMELLSEAFPDGIKYTVSLDTTKPITAGIAEILETLVVALLLVILVVYLFIQDWRATLIPTLAIPVSLIGAFALFPSLGFTVNVLSLLGLVLAIGIVVDDAIVVVEAVQVKMEEGLSARQATSEAMKEVMAPVIATTLVLIAVFVPVAGMAGITGRLYQQFAITIAVSVAISSINALTLSPALCALLMKPASTSPGWLGKFFAGFNKAFDRTTDSYMNITNVFARKLSRGVVMLVAATIGAMLLGKLVPGGFMPEEDMGYCLVNVQLPNASSLQRTDKISAQVEQILLQQEEVEYVTTVSGFSLLSGAYNSNNAFFFVGLKDWDLREGTAREFTQKLNRMLFGIKNAVAFSFTPPPIPGLGNGSGFSIMIQDKSGGDPAYLFQQTMAFVQAANARPEIASAFSQYQSSVPQRYVDLDIDKILKTGVNLQDVYNTFGAFLGGSYVNDFNRYGRLYKSYVQAENEYRQSPEKLDLFYVRNNQGGMVPISTFATVEEFSGPDYTNRFNLLRSAEVTGQPAKGYSSAQAMAALEEVAAEVLPPDVGYTWNAMSFQEKKASGSSASVFILSLIFVFLILAAQYESWSMPFAILLGTPLALFGAFLFLWLARFSSETFENNVFAQISLVMLIAMAAKNAILIVEFANIKFNEGLSLFDSAVEAARLRFRPILMTVFSFILGILPLILASGTGAEARKVMGMALLGGIGIATLLGVFIYPMLFILIGKIFGYEKKRDQLKAEEA